MSFSGSSMWNRKSLDSVSDDHEGSVLAGQFRNYAEGTSIHGIKYTCEPGRTAVEK